jgi:hypothetical protein
MVVCPAAIAAAGGSMENRALLARPSASMDFLIMNVSVGNGWFL